MSELRLANITFDAHDPERLAAFWSEAMGLTPAHSDANIVVLTSDRDAVRWLFLKVPEGKVAKNRMHVDLHAADRDAEVARLVALGATRHESHHLSGIQWTVMADPEGNEFCIAQG